MDLSTVDLRPYMDYKVGSVISIRKKYGFRVTLIYEDLTEKECQHSGYEKKADAEKARDGIIAQLHDKRYVVYRNVKVRELLEYWLEYVMKIKPKFKANSYASYKNCIFKHINPKIGNINLLKVNSGHVRKLLNELSEKYSSIPKIARPILNTAFGYAVTKNLMVDNPCEHVKMPAGKNKYHTIVVKESQTYNLEQVKMLLKAGKNTRIYMQLLFALLMGLRISEINGLKYSDIDYERHKLKINVQLGEDLHADPAKIPPKMKTKQEIAPKTKSSVRELDIPDIVFYAILEERKRYEKNRSRRQHGVWTFQDKGYICCSSYGRPRCKNYHYKHYKELLDNLGLPHIRFHDLRHTYSTLLMKNNINQKAIAVVLGHAKSIITVDVYTDKKAIIEDWLDDFQPFIDEVHPYDEEDIQMLKDMFGIEKSIDNGQGIVNVNT